jgi:hypothetical protein
LRQGLADISHGEVHGGVEARQVEAVKAGRRLRPGVEQDSGGVGDVREGGQGPGGLVPVQREAFDGEDLQMRVGGPRAAPQRQQGGDVEPRAEPHFGDAEPPASGPGLRQAAAVEKDRARLGQPIFAGEVDVVEPARTRRAVVGPDQAGRAVVGHRRGPTPGGAACNEKGPAAVRL